MIFINRQKLSLSFINYFNFTRRDEMFDQTNLKIKPETKLKTIATKMFATKPKKWNCRAIGE